MRKISWNISQSGMGSFFHQKTTIDWWWSSSLKWKIKSDKSTTCPDQPQLISWRIDKMKENSSLLKRIKWLVKILANFITGQERLGKEENSCSLFTNLVARGSTRKSILFLSSLQFRHFFGGRFYVIQCNLWCSFVCACLKFSFRKIVLIFVL